MQFSAKAGNRADTLSLPADPPNVLPFNRKAGGYVPGWGRGTGRTPVPEGTPSPLAHKPKNQLTTSSQQLQAIESTKPILQMRKLRSERLP